MQHKLIFSLPQMIMDHFVYRAVNHAADTDLIAGNISVRETIFGFTGTQLRHFLDNFDVL